MPDVWPLVSHEADTAQFAQSTRPVVASEKQSGCGAALSSCTADLRTMTWRTQRMVALTIRERLARRISRSFAACLDTRTAVKTLGEGIQRGRAEPIKAIAACE